MEDPAEVVEPDYVEGVPVVVPRGPVPSVSVGPPAISVAEARRLAKDAVAPVRARVSSLPPAPAAEEVPEPVVEAERPGVNNYDIEARDFGKELEAAKLEAGQNRGLAMMSRGFDTAGSALAGRKPDDAFYKTALDAADAPVKMVEADAALHKLALSGAAEREKKDPASKSNRQFQDAIIHKLPGFVRALGGPEAVRNATRDQIEKLLGVHEKEQTQDLNKKRFAHEVERDRLAQERHADNLELGYAKEFYEGGRKAAGGSDYQDRIDRRYAGQDVRKFKADTKALAAPVGILYDMSQRLPNGISSLVSATNPTGKPDELENILSRLPAGAGSQINPKDAVRYRSSFGALQALIRHPITGANLTDEERAEWDRIFQSGVLADPLSQAVAIDVVRHMVYRNLQNAAALSRGMTEQFDPGLWGKLFIGTGGIDETHPVFKDIFLRDIETGLVNPETSPYLMERALQYSGGKVKVRPQEASSAPNAKPPAAAPQTGGKVKVTNGSETLVIDAADVEAAKADGFRVVP